MGNSLVSFEKRGRGRAWNWRFGLRRLVRDARSWLRGPQKMGVQADAAWSNARATGGGRSEVMGAELHAAASLASGGARASIATTG